LSFFYFSVTARPVKVSGHFPVLDYLSFLDGHIPPHDILC